MALIYVVEDDESIREIETIALKNSGHIVSAFECAKDFFKKIDEILPDLVLLDIMLPDESGYEIIKKLRARTATKRLPVIMVTAKSTELDMIKGLEDGADDYIKKPFSVMELITRVKALLRRTDVGDVKVMKLGEIELNHERHTVTVSGENVEQNFKQFMILCKTSALQGNSHAQYIMGIFYEEGILGLERYFESKIEADEKYYRNQ